VKLGGMQQGEVFGEISFLEGGNTTAAVVADQDDTEIYVIAVSHCVVVTLELNVCVVVGWCVESVVCAPASTRWPFLSASQSDVVGAPQGARGPEIK